MWSTLLTTFATLLFTTPHVLAAPTPTPRPLVIWHGLGDTAHGEGMLDFIEAIKGVHPGIFVHSIYINEKDDEDKKATFFGNLYAQLEIVYEQLTSLPELEGGFDAIGFSQGGQFLRAYQEFYNEPPMHNLITFGSQHMGISELPACGTWDILCHLLHQYARGRVYSEWAQTNLIPAQYFRDPDRLEEYYASNAFLPAVNNEIASSRNATYAKNLAALSNLVLVVFSNDTTVVPKESGWFGSHAPSNSSGLADPRQIISMREQPLYTEDWIGLKELDERGGLVELTCIGAHMHISAGCWKPLVKTYCGGLDGVSSRPVLRIQG